MERPVPSTGGMPHYHDSHKKYPEVLNTNEETYRKKTRRTSTFVLSAISLALTASGSGDDDVVVEEAAPDSVQKARCGPGDKPETGCRARCRRCAPPASRASTAICSSSARAGATARAGSTAFFEDKAGHKCNYYDTASSTANRTQLGVVVIDATNPARADAHGVPRHHGDARSVGIAQGQRAPADAGRRQRAERQRRSRDRSLRHLRRLPLSAAAHRRSRSASNDGTGQFVAAVRGHEGNFAPDGLTYYAANLGAGYIYPIDITNPTKPKHADAVLHRAGPGARPQHQRRRQPRLPRDPRPGASPIPAASPGSPPNNGLHDPRHERGPGAQVPIRRSSVVSVIVWDDGGGAQHTIRCHDQRQAVRHPRRRRPAPAATARQAGRRRARLNLPPWQLARIIDISDETKPTIVSKLMLETHDPENCAQGPARPGGGSDQLHLRHPLLQRRQQAERDHAGVRLLQLGHPRVRHPRSGAGRRKSPTTTRRGMTTPSPGSQHNPHAAAGWPAVPTGARRRCRLDAATGTLQTTCQDNGFLSLKFTNGVWPFPRARTPPGLQN